MSTASGTVYFHYSGDKVVYETDSNNNIIAEYTWDAQGNPISMTKNGSTYYYHLNGRGDVTALTDASGGVVAQYQYDTWGNITASSGAMKDANPYRYAGYRYDNETGLYYLNARYYDASVGRFITRDTFEGFMGIPQSLNLYVYCQNNPNKYVDHSGHIPGDWLRNTIGLSASAYLQPKGLTLTLDMFLHGLYGNGAAYTNYSLLISRLKPSAEIQKWKYELFRISNGKYVHYHSPTELLILGASAWFRSTRDLALAVGKAKFNMYAQKINGRWQVSVKVWDLWNFEEFRWGLSESDLANNFGLALEYTYILKPFTWSVRFSL